MPTVGCEADAIAFTEEDASSSSSSSDSSTESSSDSSSGLYYSADGSYSSGDFGAPAVLCGADLLHTLCCVKLLRELCKPVLMERRCGLCHCKQSCVRRYGWLHQGCSNCPQLPNTVTSLGQQLVWGVQ
jgi:hypothetical protein